MDKRDLIEKSNSFSFDDFFSSKDDLAALMVITPSFEYVLEADVHEEAADLIYSTLYDEKIDTDDYFAFCFNDRGDVCIQLMNKDFIIVNIPDNINDYQYERLSELNRIVASVDDAPEIHTNVFDGDNHLDLNEALSFFKRSSKIL